MSKPPKVSSWVCEICGKQLAGGGQIVRHRNECRPNNGATVLSMADYLERKEHRDAEG